MYREAIEKLKEWKSSPRRKPLVLMGARQVGKTWLLEEFGKNHYKSIAYFNFEKDNNLAEIFELNFDTKRIIGSLENSSEVDIVAGETLIILDEIQECPRALESLKYFCEDAPEYHIAVAGSLLGISLHENASFPVGKVNFLEILPMSFYEFLYACDKKKLAETLRRGNDEEIFPFHKLLLEEYKIYTLVGGMPEVVKTYIEDGNLLQVKQVQEEILMAYERDFSKHAPINVVPKIRDIFDIIPSQLGKENKKFIFSQIRSGARAKEYDAALLWLEDAGVARRVVRTKTIKSPLKSYADSDAFKLYMLDSGLLCAKAGLTINTIMNPDELFVEFKGTLAEQMVFEKIIEQNLTPMYYANDDSRGEIDFIIETESGIKPIEVKSGRNLISKSLNAFLAKNPETNHAIKFSILPHTTNEKIENMPLYWDSNNIQ